MKTQFSLRTRIFVAMISLILVASMLIAGVTIYQYQEQSNEYHQQRLERKEIQLQTSIAYVLQNTLYSPDETYLDSIFRNEIYQIADVQNVNFNIYNLSGNLVLSSIADFNLKKSDHTMNKEVLSALMNSSDKRFVEKIINDEGQFRSLYTYIVDAKFKPIGILNLPYFDDDSLSSMELREFLIRLIQVYFIMFLVAILLAFLVSKYITKSLGKISYKMARTSLNKRNEKINVPGSGKEISALVNAYNNMVDKLKDSAEKLAKSEREQAWREMAKQVAHEIKNPLTPMRLTVQSFQKKFNSNQPPAVKEIDDFSNTLIQQIDTMTSIASAFSNFAQMPAQQSEQLDVVKITKLALDIFNEKHIQFESSDTEIRAIFDRTQLIRVITNLVKNALQACENLPNPIITVSVQKKKENVMIEVIDNGVGIEEKNTDKIFEPKFTTKTSGMGLGLAMVKNILQTYNGTITLTSTPNKKTTFRVVFPAI